MLKLENSNRVEVFLSLKFNRSFMPNVSPCGFVRDLGKELFSQVSDEAARRNVRHKRPILVTNLKA